MKEESSTIRYLNRALSWLHFNGRVLQQACSPRHPLLERLRFLAIASSNYDEFVMKRVGHVQRLIRKNVTESGIDKAEPEILFRQLRERALQFNVQRYSVLKDLQQQLAHQGVHFITWQQLSVEEKNSACKYFKSQVFPVLTPLAFDAAHPFPFLSNLSFSMGLTLHRPKSKKEHFARIKVPSSLPQWFLVQRLGGGDTGSYFLPLQELVENNLHACFPNMVIEHVVAFRVTRSADVEQARDDMDAQLDLVEEQLRQRRLANIVRLECSDQASPHIVSLLQKQLNIQERDTYLSPGPLNYQAFSEVVDFHLPHLKYQPWLPTLPRPFKSSTSVLDVIDERDVLVHHPYESYSDSVERFVKDAVEDPRVMVIKISLYRAGTDNPIIPLLIQAAEEGKQVACVLELKARFDEAHNIHLGEKLTKKGVHVVYGVVDKKTHAKSILIIRREGGGFKYYTHIGTGNYNPKTARVYSDFALFTSHPQIAAEVLELFNSLTGVSGQNNYNQLLVAPVNMRSTFVRLIESEIQHAVEGRPARIVAKMNNFEDKQICDLLYEASQKGVQVDLIVRGFCCLRPGVKGLSENIRVHSVIGRFLEHSRVYYFQSGQTEAKQGQFFIGSADWRYRNFDKRVEVVVPILCKKIKKQLWSTLKIWLKDDLAWHLQADGRYKEPAALLQASDLLSAQQQLMHKVLKKTHKSHSVVGWALQKGAPDLDEEIDAKRDARRDERGDGRIDERGDERVDEQEDGGISAAGDTKTDENRAAKRGELLDKKLYKNRDKKSGQKREESVGEGLASGAGTGGVDVGAGGAGGAGAGDSGVEGAGTGGVDVGAGGAGGVGVEDTCAGIFKKIKKKITRHKKLRIGVIDLGTNSIKVDIARVEPLADTGVAKSALATPRAKEGGAAALNLMRGSLHPPLAEAGVAKSALATPRAKEGGAAALNLTSGSLHSPLARSIHYEKHMVRLGDGVYQTGVLSKAVMQRGLQAMCRINDQLVQHKVDEVVCLATSALRQARNADEFIHQVFKKTGIRVQVISGSQEAQLIARGVLQDPDLQKQNFMIVDIGGGSTEFILCSQGQVLQVLSAPLGVNQILQNCPDKNNLESFLTPYVQNLKSFLWAQGGVLAQHSARAHFANDHFATVGDFMVGTSGTMRSLWGISAARGGARGVSSAAARGAVADTAAGGVAAGVVGGAAGGAAGGAFGGGSEVMTDGRTITRAPAIKGPFFDFLQLDDLIDRIRPLGVDDLKKLPGLEPERADLILGGAVLVQQVLKVFQIKGVLVHSASLRQGVWRDLVT